MPAVLALPAFWGAVAAGAGGGAAIYGANKTSGAAENAANLQSDSAAKALAFQKQQAALDARNNAASQLASYGQYASRENRIGQLGQMFGLPARDVPPPPAYLTAEASPGYDPFSATGGNPLPSTPTTPTSTSTTPSANPVTANLSDPKAWMALVGNDQALSQWVQQGLGPKADPGLVNYYVGKIKGQPGANPTEQAGSANYWMQKLQTDPSVTGRVAPTASAAVPSTAANMFLPQNSVLTPALQMPGGR